MLQYDSYIICTTPRSGSTLLCKLLASTSKSGNPESWFHTPSLEDWTQFHLKASVGDFTTPREAFLTVLQAAQEHGTKNTGIFGLRMQKDSLDYFVQQLNIAYPEIPNDSGRIEAAFGRTLYIYLSRQDRLDQAISYTKASQTGLWHMAPDGTELERLSAPKEPVYDTDTIAHCLNKTNAGNRHWERWFEHQEIEPLHILYEELSQDPVEILHTIFEHLGLIFDPGSKVEPGVAKLADRINQSWKERYLSETNTN